MVDALFWFCVVGVSFSYFIYPTIMTMLPNKTSTSNDNAETSNYQPLVTIIIPAYNEESRIDNKIKNTLELAYPEAKLDIIFASDASTDDTENVIKSYDKDNIRIVRSDERRGKEFAQSLAINHAKGEIIVFTDVSTILPPDCIQILTAQFSNPKIGAVSSEDRIIDEHGKVFGESLYVKYEMWLRRLESRKNSLVGLSGSFFAARKKVCESWNPLVPGDFNVALNCAIENYTALSDPDVIGIYQNITDESKEYQRKLRTIIHGLSAISYKKEVLNPFKYGLFSFQVWGHKIMRWLVPWFMLALLIINLVLVTDHWFYQITLISQIIFYSISLMGHFSKYLQQNIIFKVPTFFVQVNAAIFHASILFLKGERMAVWEPSKR